jgi:prepilin-type processing-associated H-X9-DG protein/prepilin-type N-terminal cleavage/methylation domain-containing protein
MDAKMKPKAQSPIPMYIGTKASFTLIELLVVVAIIAVLVAVLLPGLQMARAKAKSLPCLSRFHQVAMMFGFYHGEFPDGPIGFRGWSTWRPTNCPDPFPTTAYFGWYSGERNDRFGKPWWGIGKYVNTDIGQDSSGVVRWSSQRAVTYCSNNLNQLDPTGNSAGYAVNWDKGLQTVLPDPTKLARPDNSPVLWCGTYLVGGVPDFDYVCYPRNYMWGWTNFKGDEMVSGGYYVHGGSSNLLFFDGHAIAQPALPTPDDYLYRFDWGTRYKWR